MNLKKSTRYALHAALDLARAAGEPVTSAQVAARHGIPEHVVAKVLQALVRAGIASASRGVGGGYRLARPAGEVSVQDVIDLFEAVPTAAAAAGDAPAVDRLDELFHEVDETVRATLASVTLATLVG